MALDQVLKEQKGKTNINWMIKPKMLFNEIFSFTIHCGKPGHCLKENKPKTLITISNSLYTSYWETAIVHAASLILQQTLPSLCNSTTWNQFHLSSNATPILKRTSGACILQSFYQQNLYFKSQTAGFPVKHEIRMCHLCLKQPIQ